jgi:hypothetical protein
MDGSQSAARKERGELFGTSSAVDKYERLAASGNIQADLILRQLRLVRSPSITDDSPSEGDGAPGGPELYGVEPVSKFATIA